MSHAVPEPRLFADINVTPFIDVLLVLLIMLIMTIPIATQNLPIDLPSSGTTQGPIETHKLAVDARGGLFWDARPVSDADLPALLKGVAQHDNQVLHFQPDPEARYERVDSVLVKVKRAGVTRLGFVGHEAMRL